MKKAIPIKYLKKDWVFKTRYLQNPKTGYMEGRERVNGLGDTTAVLRLSKDVDINGDRKPDFFKGEILGRNEAIGLKKAKTYAEIRASKSKKGHIRRL